LKTIILPGNGICSALREKGGKEKELPVHHKLEELLDQYLKVTGLEKEPGGHGTNSILSATYPQ
jgi:hypothetical protein